MNSNAIEILEQFNRGKLLFATFDAETKELIGHGARHEASWDDFVDSLPEHRCAFFLVHVDYFSTSDRVTRSKSALGRWCPELASTRDKMNATFFSKKFVAEISPFVPALGETRIQASSIDEVDRETIVERVTRFVYAK